MATFLETGLLRSMLPLFSFLFILVVSFALLQKTQVFGGKKGIDWVISLSLAVMMLFAGQTLNIINYFVPWLMLIAIFLTFVFLIFIFLGYHEKESDLKKEIWSRFGGYSTVVVISILLIVIGISSSFTGVFDPYQGEGDPTIGGEIVRTIFDAKVLGALLVLLIAAFAVSKISEEVNKS